MSKLVQTSNSWGVNTSADKSIVENIKSETVRIIIHIFTVTIGLLCYEIVRVSCVNGKVPTCLLKATLIIFIIYMIVIMGLTYNIKN